MVYFGLEIIPCPLEVRTEALQVLYHQVPNGLRQRLIAQIEHEVSQGEIELSGLWIARERNGRIIGALLTQPLAGKAVAVWAPEVYPSWRRDILATRLIQKALIDLKTRGFLLAQAVLDESTNEKSRYDLTRGGMPRITELLYLERDTALSLPLVNAGILNPQQQLKSSSSNCFEWQVFEPSSEAKFRAVLQSTYIKSLDMPELEAIRSLDDIIESHRAVGRFKAERWQLGHVPGDPEAYCVLLIAEFPERDVWEVVYLGLTPAARGRGLGRLALQHAIELARPHVSQIELAVDCRNQPALRLYQAAGFTIRSRRAVHLAILV